MPKPNEKNSISPKVKAMIDSVVTKYETKGNERSGNSAYNSGGYDLGSDMLQAVRYAKNIIASHSYTGDDNTDIQSICEALENSRALFEETHTDIECFGTGTLGSIAQEIGRKINE